MSHIKLAPGLEAAIPAPAGQAATGNRRQCTHQLCGMQRAGSELQAAAEQPPTAG
jgi:hypothetical protein